MPEGDIPGWFELPGTPGVEGAPGLVVELPAVPGSFPHGEPVGLRPGFVFGLTANGMVLLPGAGRLVEFAPGL